jgi:plastocyanin
MVEMGASTPHTDILAVNPVPASVKLGDKVTFVNNSTEPHTASFFGQQPPIQSPADPRADTAIPGPSPQRLNTKDLFNTGLLPPNAPPGAGPPFAARSFSFTVPAAGEYSYVCILHSPSGMAGAIKAS